jgi:serine/threonine-protein phosphatase 2A regulatory subunit B
MGSLGEPDPNNVNKHDILSSMAFCSTGQMLAVGDYGGRCIVFERETDPNTNKESFEYQCEFQAHSKSLDVLSN